MPDARELEVPPMTLVAVTVEAAVQLLEGPYVLADGREAHVAVMSYTIGDSTDVVMKVVAEREPTSVRASVWSVEEALASGQTAEELLGAIEAVLSLFSEKAEVSFHPPTRLLIARGTDEQLDLVRDAIEQLTYGAQHRREQLQSLRYEIDTLESELQSLSGEIKVAEQLAALTKTHLANTAKAREAGNANSEAVAEAELEVARAETESDYHKNQYARVQAKLQCLRDAAKRLEQQRL
jgi:chromosome segregation ATPase